MATAVNAGTAGVAGRHADRRGDPRPARVVIVPGLAVSRYLGAAVQELADRGVAVSLEIPPGAPGAAADLREYGEDLARRLRTQATDVLVGLSVGAQAAAVAAAGAAGNTGTLVLASPTVAPELRRRGRLLGRWALAGRQESPRLFLTQVPEWSRAGPVAIVRVLASAPSAYLEDVLPAVSAPLVVVHARDDVVCPHGYAAQLAAGYGGRLLILPKGTHSWPHDDASGFAEAMQWSLSWPT